jgi:hypothetical protein
VTPADASAVLSRLLDRDAGRRVVEHALASTYRVTNGLRLRVPQLPPLGSGTHEVDRIVAAAVTRARRDAEAARARAAAPAVQARPVPATPRPRAQSHGRQRRSTVARRPAPKAGSDDGPPGPHVHVELGAVDVAACQRFARCLVEQALTDVLGRQNSDGPTVGAVKPSEEKVQ